MTIITIAIITVIIITMHCTQKGMCLITLAVGQAQSGLSRAAQRTLSSQRGPLSAVILISRPVSRRMLVLIHQKTALATNFYKTLYWEASVDISAVFHLR